MHVRALREGADGWGVGAVLGGGWAGGAETRPVEASKRGGGSGLRDRVAGPGCRVWMCGPDLGVT